MHQSNVSIKCKYESHLDFWSYSQFQSEWRALHISIRFNGTYLVTISKPTCAIRIKIAPLTHTFVRIRWIDGSIKYVYDGVDVRNNKIFVWNISNKNSHAYENVEMVLFLLFTMHDFITIETIAVCLNVCVTNDRLNSSALNSSHWNYRYYTRTVYVCL